MLIRNNHYINAQEIHRKITIITANGERYSAFDLAPVNGNSTSFTAKLHNNGEMSYWDFLNIAKIGGTVQVQFLDELNGYKAIDLRDNYIEEHYPELVGRKVFLFYKSLNNIIQKRKPYVFRTTDVNIQFLEDHLFLKEGTSDHAYMKDKVDLDPIFQRGHVWTKEQQIQFIENLLSRPQSTNTLVYFNDCCTLDRLKEKTPKNDWVYNKFVCLDGLQRLTATLAFIRGEFKCFNDQIGWQDILNAPDYLSIVGDCNFKFHSLSLKSNIEVAEFYLDFNASGTPHSADEIERVKELVKSL